MHGVQTSSGLRAVYGVREGLPQGGLTVPGTVLPDTLRPMPPVGVTIPSPELDNMKKWINSLPPCK